MLATAGAALTSLAATTPALASADDVALVMGPTFVPHPDADYVASVNELYIANPVFTPSFGGYTPVALDTPEQDWPLTGLGSLPFNQSRAEGVTILTDALNQQLGDGNHVVAFGYSQSASIITIVKRDLDALPAGQQPSPEQLGFVLVGNSNRPDGGLFERYTELYSNTPVLGETYNGATPNDAYPTLDVALQYDGFADYPQYPIDLLADLNAELGKSYVHTTYQHLTSEQVATGVIQPVSADDPNTTYVMIPTQDLPLLDPLRQLGVPAALLDLIQPDLRVIVDLGYDRTAPQDVPTPAGLFGTIDLAAVVNDLGKGAEQGMQAALVDLGLRPDADLPDAYPYLPDVLGMPGL